jgi:hypothetical protein
MPKSLNFKYIFWFYMALVFFFSNMNVGYSQGPPPPPNCPTPPCAPVPLDDYIWIILIGGVFYGIISLGRRSTKNV